MNKHFYIKLIIAILGMSGYNSDVVYAGTEYNVTPSVFYKPNNDFTLWYTVPPTATDSEYKWMEYALPLGNGQLGGAVLNGIKTDEIQFNEKTLWSGGPSEYGSYLNFGSLFIDNLDGIGVNDTLHNYYRSLDLTTAIASSGFSSSDGNTEFLREYIASNPDSVIAIRMSANRNGILNRKIRMIPGRPGLDTSTEYKGHTASFCGKLNTLSYAAMAKVFAIGGRTESVEDGIIVRDADEIFVILTGGTDFDAYTPSYTSGETMDQLRMRMSDRIQRVAKKDWTAVLADHVTDYGNLFGRVKFALKGVCNNLPTNELIEAYNVNPSGANLALEQLYFQFGRYLSISSSRGVALPSNLQGIWNDSSTPPWSSDIHANINVQMNYWPCEAANLSEMHLPFLEYIINEATHQSQWREHAKTYGHAKRGWTCLTENNIFGAISGFAPNYVIANAWYCTHLWQHYQYTLDEDFLLKAFPAMLSACQFWIDRLIPDADGTYVAPDEYSPEHGPKKEDGVAHAQQLLNELFANTLEAVDILADRVEVPEDDLAKIRNRYANLDRGLGIEQYSGQWGNEYNGIKKGDNILREWKKSPYSVGDKSHRHPSHLMALYPLNQITADSPYFEAAINSLQLRGDASTGWSMGWKINHWARALDGNHAYKILNRALRHSTSYEIDQRKGGIYYNLWDACSPFQIDGNFGATAGIIEMLLQSNADGIHILPSLPLAWSSGSISGLKSVGGHTVGIEWDNGKIVRVTLGANTSGSFKVKGMGIGNMIVESVEDPEESGIIIVANDNSMTLSVIKGRTYVIF